MSTSVESLSVGRVSAESDRIIKAHLRHFLSLSLLFVLPLSFSLVSYATRLRLYTSHHHHPTLPSLSLLLLYALFLFSLAISAVATITYTTYHGFSGSPVKLSSAIKSLHYSFLPLASTALASLIIQVMISLVFVLLVLFVTKLGEILGFEIDYKSSGFIGFCVILSIILLVVLVLLQVNWALACVIAVVELKWGFEPLWRSAYLVNGMRSVTTSLLFIYGGSYWFLVGRYLGWVPTTVGMEGWRVWLSITQTVATAMYMFYYIIIITVVFVYCKVLHGESAVAEEFAGEPVRLPLDDEFQRVKFVNV